MLCRNLSYFHVTHTTTLPTAFSISCQTTDKFQYHSPSFYTLVLIISTQKWWRCEKSYSLIFLAQKKQNKTKNTLLSPFCAKLYPMIYETNKQQTRWHFLDFQQNNTYMHSTTQKMTIYLTVLHDHLHWRFNCIEKKFIQVTHLDWPVLASSCGLCKKATTNSNIWDDHSQLCRLHLI